MLVLDSPAIKKKIDDSTKLTNEKTKTQFNKGLYQFIYP